MKTIKNIKLVSILFFVGLIAASCVKDDDFDTPEINVEEPNVEVNTTIANIKEMYQGFEPVLIQNGGNEMYMEGYVVSSDETGNFYKTLVIQDSPENPENGISISTEAVDMYSFFEPGRKVYVRVDGLYTGEYAGLPTLGVLEGEEIGRMSIQDFEERVLRSTEVKELVPNIRTINNVSEADLNTLVAFENVQVSDADLGEPYGNIDNTFSVNRTITNCERTAEIIIRNSGFADFKNETMPEGNGTLTAVFSAFNSDFQLFIRDTDDLNFDQERCEEEDDEPTDALFFEDFEAITTTGNGVNINLEGWTNVSLTGGEELFEAREFDDNIYAQITAFNSEEDPMEAWLVTPTIDLTGTESPLLSFLTKDGFNNGDGLRVYISTNFSGDVEAADWTEITDAELASGTSDGYAETFTESGDIDLSDYTGQDIVVAFQYEGGESGVTTTYQIDNVTVFEE